MHPWDIGPKPLQNATRRFVFYKTDGTHCRLHPSPKTKNDAAPVSSRPQVDERRATEMTASSTFWTALPENPYTYTTACIIRAHDRIDKTNAYQSLQNAPLGPLPTTAEATFKWWLFVASLGHKTRNVFGEGLIAAELPDKTADAVGIHPSHAQAAITPQQQSTSTAPLTGLAAAAYGYE